MFINKITQGNTTFKGIYDPNILITGSSGYIGSHLISELTSEGYNCIVCCRNKNKKEYLKKVIDEINSTKTDKSLYSFADTDLTDEAEIKKLIYRNKPIDGVIHLSGSTYNSESIVNPRKYYANNVFASGNLVNAMLDNDIKNLLFVSTASIYTDNTPKPVNELMLPNPKTPYAKTKYMAEELINDYKTYGLKPIILRLFNVAGAHGTNDLDIGKNVINPNRRIVILDESGISKVSKSIIATTIHTDTKISYIIVIQLMPNTAKFTTQSIQLSASMTG